MTTFLPLAYFRHFYRVLYHKHFVLIAGRRVGRIPLWRLVKHDWSKFTPTEWHGYALQFFTPYKGTLQWRLAWIHHWSYNDHHPEHWAYTIHDYDTTSISAGSPRAMTEVATREMVADWLAASRAYNGSWPMNRETWDWWNTAGQKLPLAWATRVRVEQLLNEYFAQHGTVAAVEAPVT